MRWTEEEKDILINSYNNLERVDIIKLLSNRKWSAITKMAQIMGIAKRYQNPNILLSNYKIPNEYIYYDKYFEIVVKNRRTQEEFLVKVSNEDMELVKKYKWFIKRDSNKIYIRTCYRQERYKSTEIMLHRLLFNNPKDMVIDHINGDSLDNRRENLRCVTASVNCRNKTFCNNNTGIMGIKKICRKSGDRYEAKLQHDGIKIFCKTYKTIDEAKVSIEHARDYLYNQNTDIPQYIIDLIEDSRQNKKPYLSKFNKFRNKILERDNFACKGCWKSTPDDRSNLHIHHIVPTSIYPEGEYEEDNCIILCRECHESIKGREIESRHILKSILEQEGLLTV